MLLFLVIIIFYFMGPGGLDAFADSALLHRVCNSSQLKLSSWPLMLDEVIT